MNKKQEQQKIKKSLREYESLLVKENQRIKNIENEYGGRKFNDIWLEAEESSLWSESTDEVLRVARRVNFIHKQIQNLKTQIFPS
jgi:hypothetical protein